MKNHLSVLFSLLFTCHILISFPIQAQWVRTNGPGGARIYSFTASGGYIFAGAETGVHMSADNGSSWTVSGTGLPENNSFPSLASNGTYILAGTHGKGIYISTNMGTSWTESSNGLPDLKNGSVNGLVFSGDTAFAGVYTGNISRVYFSIDSGQNWTSASNGLPENTLLTALAAGKNRLFAATYNGVYRSTDNGLNWHLRDSGITAEVIRSLAVNGDTVYAGTDYGGVFGSFDGGASWKQLPAGLGSPIRALAVKGSYVYAGIYLGNYRSTDNGQTWNSSTMGLTDYTINTLYIKDSLVFAGTYSGGVFVSSDKGLSWSWANNGLNYSVASAMIIKDSILFAGTAARVYSSSDNGDSWNARYKGLDSSSVISFTSSGNDIFALDESRISHSSDNGLNWTSITNNLPLTKFYAAAAAENYIFAGTDSGVFLSTDKGANWKPVNNGIKTYVDGILKVTHLTIFGNIIFAGAKIDPGGGGIFVSTDHGENWIASISEQGMPFDVNAITAAGSKIFVGYNFGYMHRQYASVSYDSGKSWKGGLKGFEPYSNISNFFAIGNSVFAKTVDEAIYKYSEADSAWVKAPGIFPEKLISTVYSNKYVFAGTEGLGIFRRPISEIITILPAAPKLLSVSNNSQNQPLDLTLSWDGSSGADKYNLQVATDSLFKNIVINDSAAVSPKEIKGMKEGLRYYWKVCSRNSAGEGPFSEVWNFTTILYAPEGLSVIVQNKNILQFSWLDKSQGEQGFIIERKQDLDFKALDTLKAGSTSYTDTTANQVSTYKYRVKAFTPFTSSEYSNTVSVIISGIDEVSLIPREFRLFQNYPNPFNPVSTIRYWLPVKSFVELKIFDILGREVSTLINEERDPGEYKFQFNAARLPSGIYIYTINAGQFRDTKKFILLK